MNTRNLTTRILSMLLVLVMVFGMVPMQAFAVENATVVDAAIIYTDLHTSSSNYKESTLKGVLNAIKNAGLPVSSVTSSGDLFSSNESVSTGYTDTFTGYIQDVFGKDISVGYVWSDHDRGAYNNSSAKIALDKTSHMLYGAGKDGVYGTADDDNYYIFALSMADLSTNDRYNSGFHSDAQVTQAIADFLAVAKTLDHSKPLFIASHQPLFERRSDNGHALEWFEAINEVAETMDVAFFFGHNHNYDQSSDYFYSKGSTMTVETKSGTGSKQTLNFTHVCAGYLSPSTSNSNTRKGTAIAITIYDDSIRYTTYNSSGVYSSSFAVDKTVTREFAATEPELVVSGTDAYFVGSQLDLTVLEKVGSKTTDVTAKAVITGYDMNTAGDYTVHVTYGDLCAEMPIIVREKIFRDAATGITAEVSTPSATGMTVGVLASDDAAFLAAASLMDNAAGYTIDMENCTEATLTLPVPAGVTAPTVYHISADGQTITRVDASANNGTVSFTTGAFGSYVVGQQMITEDLENSLVAGGTSYEEKTVYVRVDSFENGGKYLLIGEDGPSNANPIAYLNNNGSEGSEKVTINSGSITAGSTTYTKGYIELNNSKAVWTASGSSSNGFTLTNNGYYVGGTDANTLKSSSSSAVKVTYDASAVRLKTASGTTRYFYYSTYNSENWKWSTSSSSSSSSKKMWIYKEVTVQTVVSTPVTYTIEAENVHHILTDNTLQLNYSLLANGVSADLPQGARYSFEVVNDVSGIIESISDTGRITFTKAVGSCFVKIACTWNEGTAYKYVRVSTERDPNACEHEYNAVTVDATCTEDGSVTYTCQCGDTYTEVIKATGHNYTSKVTAPTCTEAGFTTYTCRCGDTYVADKVAALGHDYASVVTKPTCTTEGYTTYTCACGHAYTADKVAATGHSYKTVTVDATCTENGSITYTCACGDTYTEVIEALGHTYKAKVTKPTCTEAGFTTYTCACGDSYVTDQVAALGHTYKSVTVDAACTENGSITYTCACGDTYAEVIEATGHDYTSVVTAPTCTEDGYTTHTCHCGHAYTDNVVKAQGHSYTTVVLKPTCIAEGYTIHTCATCGNRYTSNHVAALGHTYESFTVAPTCTEDGSITYTCHCGEYYVEVIEALGHDYDAVVTAPTCTEDGFTTFTCHCGNSYTGNVVEALGHDYESVTVEATCTENGSVTYTCFCGDTYAEVIEAKGHDHKATVTAPTCTEDGFTTYTCACGDSYVADEVAALGHQYESVTVKATCTTDGSVTYTCVCGDTYAEVIKATGHDHKATVTKPTCTEDGYTTYTCACGDTYTSDVVEALGHDYQAKVTKPTCTKDGYTTYSCACGDTYTADVVEALGHDHEAVITTPTCTEDGYTTYTCHCGDTYVADKVAALGHDYESVTVEATCTADGSVTYTCHCGDTYVEVIKALGHDYESVVTAPTCTEEGFTTYTCATCGHSYTANKVAALGHDYETVTVKATCTENGSITYTCHCGDTYGEVIEAKGHDHKATVTAPTCTEAGFTTYTCHCGDTYTADQVKALGHNYTCVESGSYLHYTCSRCGDAYSEKNATYSKVTSISNGNDYVVVMYSSGRYYALSHANNTLTPVQITVSNGEITSEITKDMLWNLKSNKLRYEDGSKTYSLYGKANSLTVSTSKSSKVTFKNSKLKLDTVHLQYANGKLTANTIGTTVYMFTAK